MPILTELQSPEWYSEPRVIFYAVNPRDNSQHQIASVPRDMVPSIMVQTNLTEQDALTEVCAIVMGMAAQHDHPVERWFKPSELVAMVEQHLCLSAVGYQKQ